MSEPNFEEMARETWEICCYFENGNGNSTAEQTLAEVLQEAYLAGAHAGRVAGLREGAEMARNAETQYHGCRGDYEVDTEASYELIATNLLTQASRLEQEAKGEK